MTRLLTTSLLLVLSVVWTLALEDEQSFEQLQLEQLQLQQQQQTQPQTQPLLRHRDLQLDDEVAAEERELLISSFNRRCHRRLATCQASLPADTLPTEDWLANIPAGLNETMSEELEEILAGLDSMPSTGDTYAAMAASDGATKLTVALRLGNVIGLLQNQAALLTQLGQSQIGEYIQIIYDVIAQVTVIVESVINIVNIVQPIVALITSIVGIVMLIVMWVNRVVTAVNNGVPGIIVLILQIIIAILGIVGRNAKTAILFPTADVGCLAALSDCRFETNLFQLGPALLELADAAAAAAGP